MRKWKVIPIGATQYTVYLASANEMRKVSEIEDPAQEAVGLHDGEAGKIYILDTLTPSQFVGALAHELLHASIHGSAANTHLENVGGRKWSGEAEEVLVRSIESVLVPALVACGWKPKRK